MQQRKSSWLSTLIFSLALIVGVAVLWSSRFNIYDWWQLRGYQVPAYAVQLATDTTMNDRTRRMFYAYHPALEDKSKFGTHCGESEKTIVLGCYVLNRGIYLFKVSDSRLQGVQQVTAGHETLHAAYDRLSSKERKHVDALTAQAYAQVTDERLRSTIDSYRQRDPSIVPNELHSILGTEVRNLPAELETYYKRYFANRGAVVSFSEQYEAEFTGRKQQVATYDTQLKILKTQIEDLEKSRDAQLVRLNSESDRLQALRKAGQFEAYNAGVPGYQQMIKNYNAGIREEQALIAQFNDIVQKRNNLALEENELLKAIDSRPDQISTQ